MYRPASKGPSWDASEPLSLRGRVPHQISLLSLSLSLASIYDGLLAQCFPRTGLTHNPSSGRKTTFLLLSDGPTLITKTFNVV